MSHSFDTEVEARGLCTFVDAAPSPFHAVQEVGRLLDAAGFTELAEADAWPTQPGRYFTVRGGSLAAWSTEHADGPATPFRVLGAHTDSPNFRVRPNPDLSRHGWAQLTCEVYGGPLLNSWLDRDLGLSGRVGVRGRDGVETRLVHVDTPILRIPQLAIHFDRTANDALTLNPQTQLVPVWGTGGDVPSMREFLAGELEVDGDDVLAWDLMTHDLTPSTILGVDRSLIAAPRLDNLGTTYCGTRAFVDAVDGDGPSTPHIQVLILFDHEEIGSMTERGGFSSMLPTVMERITRSLGGDRDDYQRALAGTVVASGDMAHATHPNYPQMHEPNHQVAINGGPVLKTNVKGRYATDAVSAGWFRIACDQAGVPMQDFTARGDMPCGSTIGPMTASQLGVTTIDFGAPMLSMHSARELMGAQDPAMYAGALSAFLSPQV
ncbi:M18 family aminopeptidase [Arsenicicoccus dermatophilus]|uniref:M18 family aminopeptidase n=1 Tax=Arsenicicoccus dermatophilus TaxID=1076331 RepID=UPI001F4D2831|nr:M18 family aminopeptidase [Arsenicicoccus dermatophilus]MCH8614239.1 M18 family aminopeptidase [Arsenicicoccus dermatophilus]